MPLITLQVLEGLERGRVFSDLPAPVTIGREEENVISLKDEQVSRLHVKLQEEDGRIILTDVSSTNGSRVNGSPVQMRVLRAGDLLSIGRCLLIFGSPEEIAEIAARSLDADLPSADPGQEHPGSRPDFNESPTFESQLDSPIPSKQDDEQNKLPKLFPLGPPDPPEGLRSIQKAEFSDYLAYLHAEIGAILKSLNDNPSEANETSDSIQLNWAMWQRLLNLEFNLATYMRKIADPDQK